MMTVENYYNDHNKETCDNLPRWFYAETAFFNDQVNFYPPESLVNDLKSTFSKKIHLEKPFDPITSETAANKSILSLSSFFEPSSPVLSRSPSPWSEGTVRSFTSSSSLSSIESTKLKRLDLIKKPSSLSIASCSLINIEDNMKLYRRLALKTQQETQITYAHYLLQIASLYGSSNPTRNRLLAEAGYWINRLANKKNHPEAIYQEGLWYLHGSDVPGYESIKIKKAKKNFQKASKKGYTAAHYELAQLLEPSKKVLKLYDKGVKEKHIPSIMRMAEIYLFGEFIQKDLKLGVEYLVMAADTDDRLSAEPCFMLSCIYGNESERVGLPSDCFPLIDYQLSFTYLKKACQYEHSDAIYLLGKIYELGLLNQHQDQWKAYQHYVQASDLQHPIAMLNLAKLYQTGIPGHLSSQNDLAFKWCKRAADLGYDQAEYTLGKYYEQGIGVTKDVQLAFECFGKAASSNHRLASEKLNRHLDAGTRRQTQHHSCNLQ